MEYVVQAAPEGFRASWRVEAGEGPEADDLLLVIEVSADLRPLDRRRHIQQALQWAEQQYGVQPRRRGIVPLPLLPGPRHLRHAVSGHKTAVTAVVGVAGAGILAVAVLPAMFDDNASSLQRRPPAAAPGRPGRPSNGSHPPTPSKPPTPPRTPRPADPPSTLPLRPLPLQVRTRPVSVTPPTGVPGVPTSPPGVPSPPTPTPPPVTTRQPSPLLTLSLPPAGVRVWGRPSLAVRAHAGPLRLHLGSVQPRIHHRP